MNTRLLIIFGASILLAIGIAFLTRQILQPPVKSLDIKVLAAAHDLVVGTKVTRADLTWQNWSSDNVNSLYITDVKPGEVDKIVDAIVRYTVIKGEPILASKFVHPNDKSLLSAIISPGKRAFTLQMGKRSNLTGLISPGDLIDIVIASKNPAKNQNAMGQTIVRKVPVIATDGRLSRDDSVKNPEPPEEVTIEVTPAEVERLAAALQDSKPTITVYSLTNSSVTEIVPEEETATQADTEPKAELAPEPEPYQDSSSQHIRTVTVLRGGSDKPDVVNFEVESDPNHHKMNTPQVNNNIFNQNKPNNQQIQGRM